MDRMTSLYQFVAFFAVAVLPWTVIGCVNGTDSIPLHLSILGSVLSLGAIIVGMVVKIRLDNIAETQENILNHLIQANKAMSEELSG